MKKLTLLIILFHSVVASYSQQPSGKITYPNPSSRGIGYRAIDAQIEFYLPRKAPNWTPLKSGALTYDTTVDLVYKWNGSAWNLLGGGGGSGGGIDTIYTQNDSTILILKNGTSYSKLIRGSPYTVGNGMTQVGRRFELGGALTKQTSITGSGFDFNFGTNTNRLNTVSIYTNSGALIEDTAAGVGGIKPHLFLGSGDASLFGYNVRLQPSSAGGVVISNSSGAIPTSVDTASYKPVTIGSDGKLRKAFWFGSSGGYLTPSTGDARYTWQKVIQNGNILTQDNYITDNVDYTHNLVFGDSHPFSEFNVQANQINLLASSGNSSNQTAAVLLDANTGGGQVEVKSNTLQPFSGHVTDLGRSTYRWRRAYIDTLDAPVVISASVVPSSATITINGVTAAVNTSPSFSVAGGGGGSGITSSAKQILGTAANGVQKGLDSLYWDSASRSMTFPAAGEVAPNSLLANYGRFNQQATTQITPNIATAVDDKIIPNIAAVRTYVNSTSGANFYVNSGTITSSRTVSGGGFPLFLGASPSYLSALGVNVSTGGFISLNIVSGSQLAVDQHTIQISPYDSLQLFNIKRTTWNNPRLKVLMRDSSTNTIVYADATGGSGTIDATPTNGSSNAVSSDGTYDALQLKQNVADMHTEQAYISGSALILSNSTAEEIIIKVFPTSTIAALTITFPATPINGQKYTFIFGNSSLGSGNVVTSFALSGNGRNVELWYVPSPWPIERAASLTYTYLSADNSYHPIN